MKALGNRTLYIYLALCWGTASIIWVAQAVAKTDAGYLIMAGITFTLMIVAAFIWLTRPHAGNH